MLSEKNKEAVKSSLLVAVAYGLIGAFLVMLAGKSEWLLTGCVSAVVGLVVGLATTWYHEEDV